MENSQDKPHASGSIGAQPGDEQAPETRKRRPYTPPRIEESGAFEHLVLTCGFAAGNLGCIRSMQGARSTR